MNRLPRLIDWNKLSPLSGSMRKIAQTMPGEVTSTEEKPVTDSFGKVHEPKPGFSGPHLGANGMAYYVKDGRKWCPYHNDFLSEESSTLDAIKEASTKRSVFDEIRENPRMLGDFCSHYGYHGKPISCLRAAFSAANPVIRKFAMLAAFDAEERILRKKADFDSSDLIIKDGTRLVYKEIKDGMMRFISQAISDAETKNVDTITFIMEDRARRSNENIIVEIIDEFIEPIPQILIEQEITSPEAVKKFADSLADYMATKYIDIKKSLDKERVGPDFTGEYFEENKQSSATDDLAKEAKKSKPKNKNKGKNIPTNPSLWKSCLEWAKRTYDVCPSAYCNGAAAKRYKSKGGKWKKSKNK